MGAEFEVVQDFESEKEPKLLEMEVCLVKSPFGLFSNEETDMW